MPSGSPKPDLIVQDLQDILHGLRRGEIIIDKWSHGADAPTLSIIDDYMLIDLRPIKQSRVVVPDKTFSDLCDKIGWVINDLSGHTTPLPHIALMDINRNQTYKHIGNMLGASLGLLPDVIEIHLEFRTIPDLKPAMKTITAAGANMTQSMQTFSKAVAQMSKLMGTSMVNVNDIPLPHEKLKDLGIGIEPIVGYRDFYPDLDDAGEVRLYSRNSRVWWPRKKLIAFCERSGNNPFHSGHDAPDARCACGIYAFDNADHPDMNDRAYVWGEVYLWGEVLICDSGYRAEFAYPKTLFVLGNHTKLRRWLVDELEQLYGVPTFLVHKKDGQTLSYIVETALHEMMKGGEKS